MKPALHPILALLGVALLLGSACTRREQSTEPVQFPFHTAPGIERVRSVAVVDCYRDESVGASAAALDRALASSLRETGLYEVQTVSGEDRDAHFHAPHRALANLNPESLRTFRENFGVDGLLIGRIDHFNSFDPIAIGLEVHLVSCRDGTTLWSATGHFDGRRDDVQQDIRRWHQATLGDSRPSIGGWQNTLQSPSLFSRYVADRLMRTLLAGKQ